MCLHLLTSSFAFSPLRKKQISKDQGLKTGQVNTSNGQITCYGVGKTDAKQEASVVSLIKSPYGKMFKILEEEIISTSVAAFHRWPIFFIESNFKVIFMKIGRNWPLPLHIKYSRKNCLFSYSQGTEYSEIH